MSAAHDLVNAAELDLLAAKNLLFIERAFNETTGVVRSAIERYATEANWIAEHDPKNLQRAAAMAGAVREIIRCYRVTLPAYVNA